MRKIFLLMLFGLFFLNSSGQSDYRPGYIINNSRDTIYGLIDYRGDIRNSEVCSFKQNSDSQVIEYKPGEIFAYRFTNSKYYITKELPLRSGNKICFAEFLINGIVNIYSLKSTLGDKFFIENEQGNISELINDEVDVVINDVAYRKFNKKYLGVLKYYFNDSKEVQEKVDKIKFDPKYLIDIAKEYHDKVCKSKECIIYEKVLPAVHLEFAPVYSINYSEFEFKGNPIYAKANFNRSINHSLGVKFLFWLPRINERISTEVDVYYNQRNQNGSCEESTSPITNVYYDIHLKSQTFGSSILIKYIYPKGIIKPSILLGYDFQFLIKNNSVRYTKKEVSGEVVELTENHDVPLPGVIKGVVAGLGLNYNLKKRSIFLQLLYSKEKGILYEGNKMFANYRGSTTSNMGMFSLKLGVTLN